MQTSVSAQDRKYGAWGLWIGYLIIVDLLFLPYFQVIILPLSLPLVICLLLIDRRLSAPKGTMLLVAIVAATVLVTGLSSILWSQSHGYAMENVKRSIQLTSTFAYFFYFYQLGKRFGSRTFPVVIIVLFLGAYLFLTYVFFVNPLETRQLITELYGRVTIPEKDVMMHGRFAYIFSDPNTGAYFLLVAVLPAYYMVRQNLGIVLALTLTIFLVLIVMQSRGALLIYVVALTVHFVWFGSKLKTPYVFATKRVVIFIALCLVVASVVWWLNEFVSDEPIAKLALERLSAEDYRQGGSRFMIWQIFVSNLLPLPIGRGYMLEVNGQLVFPHSDLVRFIYSYGFIAAASAVYFFFGRALKAPLIIFPALMAFTINTLIDEQKLLALFLAYLGMYRAGVFSVGAFARTQSFGENY